MRKEGGSSRGTPVLLLPDGVTSHGWVFCYMIPSGQRRADGGGTHLFSTGSDASFELAESARRLIRFDSCHHASHYLLVLDP